MKLKTQLGASAEQIEQLAQIVAWAFAQSPETSQRWLMRNGGQNVRVGIASQQVIAGLVEVPMGQWFGGHSVPVLGIAGVAIAPEARGSGHGFELLRQTLVSARAQSIPLCTLYPSTANFYRKLGFDYAGAFCRSSIPLAAALRVPSKLAVGELGSAHKVQVEALYRATAQRRSGYFDRGADLWDGVRMVNEKPARGVGVEGADGLSGYAYVAQRVSQAPHHNLILTDFVASTPDATRALLGYLARHHTTADELVWFGGTADARALGWFDRAPKVEVKKHWMSRLIHVEAALRARGYPALNAGVDFEVLDDVLAENAGTYRLRLEGGTVNVERTSASAEASLGCGALAALYSGFVAAEELIAAGLLNAPAAVARTLSAIFQGPAPCSADSF